MSLKINFFNPNWEIQFTSTTSMALNQNFYGNTGNTKKIQNHENTKKCLSCRIKYVITFFQFRQKIL